MKCEEVLKELSLYVDRPANSPGRHQIEEHLLVCGACRARAEEFRTLWGVLDEIPAVEPSFGFDARVRQRVAAEPRLPWFRWFLPQPRLALSMALLVVLCVWVVKVPRHGSELGPATAGNENEQFQEIKDLGVLENYDVLTNLDALSELAPVPADHPEPSRPVQQSPNQHGGV